MPTPPPRAPRRTPTPKKPPRRTRERILDTALALFNRLGEPNVSTSALAAELGISPGNLHYHFPAKDGIVDALFDRFADTLAPLLDAADDVGNVEDAWLFFHVLFESIWCYRFLYRDLNDLLSKNRRLETHFQQVLGHKARAVRSALDALGREQGLRVDTDEIAPVATAMVVVLTYWLSYEYVLDPRHALEPERAGAALLRGAFHVLSLVAPYLPSDERSHLVTLAGRYHAPEASAKEAPPMIRWTPFPFETADYRYEPDALQAAWPRLHAGDAEPWPDNAAVRAAWALYHAGEFQHAAEAGLKAAANGCLDGLTVANKAQAMQAHYVERTEARRLALLLDVAARAETFAQEQPDNANAHYLMAFALGRYGQGIRVSKALQQGIGTKVKGALEAAIRLRPAHAEAHTALGAFHAEVIDTMGALLGRTQGASKDEGITMFRAGLRLDPDSAIARVEYANGLVMLEGETRGRHADSLYVEAAACKPIDAAQRLHVELARAELAATAT